MAVAMMALAACPRADDIPWLKLGGSRLPESSARGASAAGRVSWPGPLAYPLIEGEAAIVIEGRQGTVLWESNADQRMYPASLTKMMTAALAIERGGLSRVVTISKRAGAVPETGLGLREGERVRLEDLVKGALIWSANDAAVAIAEAVSGNVDDFVALMNRQAVLWGATRTHFSNPHGLHDPRHYSTARDLAIIAYHAMQLPRLSEIVALRSFSMMRPVVEVVSPAARKKDPSLPERVVRYQRRTYTNRNRLLRMWADCDGIKTGFTSQAGNCLAASAAPDGWHALAVVLKSPDTWRDARVMLEWACANYGLVTVIKAGQGGWRVPVQDGVERKVQVVAEKTVTVLAPRREGGPGVEYRATGHPMRAPVARGQRVGRLQVLVGGRVQGYTALVAAHDVQVSTWGQIKRFSLPTPLQHGLLGLAGGVLLVGAATKAARTRRGRLAARQRGADPGGAGKRGRASSDHAGEQG